MRKRNRRRNMNLWRTGWICLVAAGLAVGCQSGKTTSSTSGRSASSRQQIDELSLLSSPMAIDLDGRIGVDGFAIRLYALNRSRPKGLPLKMGALDILMFEGIVEPPALESAPCRHRWSFPANELKRYASTTAIGTRYSFTLTWGVDAPRGDRISVVVRYCPSPGAVLYSAPSVIAVGAK